MKQSHQNNNQDLIHLIRKLQHQMDFKKSTGKKHKKLLSSFKLITKNLNNGGAF